MCIHCCRMRRTPCPTIPYSCPHCPVRTISVSCPLSSRPIAENPFLMTGPLEPPADSCDILPPRWLEVNCRLIYALAQRMDRSPEVAHYGVLQLLHANYGQVMMIARRRRNFRVPRSGFPDHDLFSTGGSLFDYNGFLIDPMEPETLGKLLRMLQDYIFRLRLLNKKYKWYKDGDDRGEILCLLSEQDELVRLLRSLFGDSEVVPVPKLLQALNEVDLNYLVGKARSGTTPWPVKSISDLYSEVVDPNQAKKSSADDDEIPEVTMQTVFPSRSSLTSSGRSMKSHPRKGTHNPKKQESLPGMHLPGMSLPGMSLPGMSLPDMFLSGRYPPGKWLPGKSHPGPLLPGIQLPGEYRPGQYSPGDYPAERSAPGRSAPGRSAPKRYLPGRSLPEEYHPVAYHPGQYHPGSCRPGESLPGKPLSGKSDRGKSRRGKSPRGRCVPGKSHKGKSHRSKFPPEKSLKEKSNQRESGPWNTNPFRAVRGKPLPGTTLPGESRPANKNVFLGNVEIPKLFYKPFSARDSSTWVTRHSISARLLPDGRIASRRVQHYRTSEEQEELNRLQNEKKVRSKKDKGKEEYKDMFGADLRRRSTRTSTRGSIRTSIRGTRKSLSGK